MRRPRVVVTGIGAVTPMGPDWPSSWQRVVSGQSGIGPITHTDASDLPIQVSGECTAFMAADVVGPRATRQIDRAAQLALAAAREARVAADVDGSFDPRRIGTVVGTGIGGANTYERELQALAERGPRRVSPYIVPSSMPSAVAAQVAIDAGAMGPAFAPTSACAAGSDAIGLAADMIRLGRADIVLAGGADAPLTRAMLAGFAVIGALSGRCDPSASRPFSRGRDGFVPSEGGVILVLEAEESARARGVVMLAEVAGYGGACDAYHVVAPEPSGRGPQAAIKAALKDAELSPHDVDYINAHGTSTPSGDLTEALVLRSVFGDQPPPVSATKSMTGHLLGAAGALEAAIVVGALVNGIIPPTINHEEDPEIGLDVVPNTARPEQIEVALSESFGFGGHNVALILRRI